MINAVREGYLKSGRTYPLNVKFIFIDKKKDHLKCLKNIAMSQAELDVAMAPTPPMMTLENFKFNLDQSPK